MRRVIGARKGNVGHVSHNKKLPFVNVFQSMGPDILHQLYQENFKYLVMWIINVYGAKEVDA